MLSGDSDCVEKNNKIVYCWFGYLGFTLASVLSLPSSLTDADEL
jgi:hypothetical protein